MAAAIQFSDSDGDPSHKPEEGLGYQLCGRENEIDYRSKIGRLIAPRMSGYKPGLQYILKSFPAGYTFWEKHRKDTPSAKAHVDRYVYGHPTRRIFRSANEFAPHALWLVNEREESCPCVCCTGKRTKNSTIKPSDGMPKLPTRPAPSATQGRALREKPLVSSKKEPLRTRLLSDLRDKVVMNVRMQDEDDVAFNIEQKNNSRKISDIAKQGAFVPRAGELVLFHTSMLHDSGPESLPTASNVEWKAGIVTQLPDSSSPILTMDEITTPNEDKSGMALNYSGFRIETMSDPNSIRKDEQLRWYYLPLANIRPFSAYPAFLSSTHRQLWDTSISNAMKCTSTFSLALPTDFVGSWPNAWILHGGIHIGSELIVVGDAIIVAPTEADEEPEVRMMAVTSIALAYKELQTDPPNYKLVSGDHCRAIEVRLHGRLFNIGPRSSSSSEEDGMDLDAETGDTEGIPRSISHHPTLRFTPYNPTRPDAIHSISLNRTIGRLHEPDALAQYGIADAIAALDFAVPGIKEARDYARVNDKRISERREAWGSSRSDYDDGDEEESSEGRQKQPFYEWFWANDRVEALGVDRWGEFDVGEGWEKFVAKERLAYEG